MNDVISQSEVQPELGRIIDEITGDWPSIADVWEEFRSSQRHSYYLRAEKEANREEFLKEALGAAQGKGQLASLLLRLQAAGLTGPGFESVAGVFLDRKGFRLQTYVNGKWQPRDARIHARYFLLACDHTCRVSIDGQHKGTGVLIRPTVVATAAHVIAPLVDGKKNAIGQSVGRLEISFFHADDMLADEQFVPAQPVKAVLHQDWLGYYSPPAPGEGTKAYPVSCVDGIGPDNGPWDLALIRLAKAPRDGLKGAPLLTAEPPSVSFGTHVLHHPAQPVTGQPMSLLWSIGEMKQALGTPMPLRWLHDANTDGGSSGAPCFDDKWRIVALHQAGSDRIGAPDQNNRAVPIFRWASEVDNLARIGGVTPYVCYATDENRVDVPVFGRRELQDRAWRAMTTSTQLDAAERVFLVQGEPRSGRSFTAAILNKLGADRCRFATVDVRNSASATSLEFAAQILGAVGSSPGSALQVGSGLTTQLRDVRNDIVPSLGQALEARSSDRPVWLVLEGLEFCDTGGFRVAQVIDALLASLDKLPRTHLVLIGWKGAVQTKNSEFLYAEPRESILLEDIVDHLLLTIAPPGFEISPQVKGFFYPLVLEQLNGQPDGPAYARAAGAAAAARKGIAAMFEAAAKRGAARGDAL